MTNSALQLNQTVPIQMKTIICMQMKQKAPSLIIVAFLGSENLQMKSKIMCFTQLSYSLCLSSSWIVHHFSNKKLNKVYLDLKLISH